MPTHGVSRRVIVGRGSCVKSKPLDRDRGVPCSVRWRAMCSPDVMPVRLPSRSMPSVCCAAVRVPSHESAHAPLQMATCSHDV